MKNFLKVCLVIAMSFAIIGIIFCGVAAATGSPINEIVDDSNWKWNGWNFYKYVHDNDDGTTEAGENYTNTYKLADVKNLKIDMKAGKLEVAESDTEEIAVYVESDNCDLSTELDEDTLKIIDNTSKKIITTYNLHIIVYVPADANLDEIDINANAGEVDITTDSLNAATATLNVDAGQLTVDALHVEKKLKVTVGAGEADINQVEADSASLDAGMGQISLDGKINGDIDADCGVGEIDLAIDGDEDDYNYDLSCGIGQISVGSLNYSALGNDKTISNGADKKLTLDCGIGAINVSFN